MTDLNGLLVIGCGKMGGSIVSGFLAVAAIQLTGVGISLQNMLHKNRQDFELELYHAEVQKRQEER